MNQDVDIRVRLRGGKVAAAELRAVSSETDRLGRSTDRTRGRLAGFRGAMGGMSGTLAAIGGASRTAAAGLGMLGGAAAATAAGVGFQHNMTMDRLRVSFTTLLKSGSKAQAFIGKLQRLAERSPVLDVAQTGQAARSLLAYGISLKEVLPLVKAIGDMSAASGKSMEETMPMAAMAIGQISSKGKLQAEEMNQLAESVGLSRKAIRKALGMTRDEFEEAFKPGKSISATRALPAIRKAMEDQSKGASDLLAKTTEGRFARLQEVFRRKMGDLTRGLFDGLGGGASKLAEGLDRIDFKKVAAGISGFLTNAIAKGREVFQGFMDTIRPAAPFLRHVLGPLLKGLAIGVGGAVVGAFKVLLPILKGVFIALGWIGQKAAPLRGVFQGIGTVLGFLFAGPILKGIRLLGKFGGVLRVVGVAARALAVPIRVLGALVGKVFGAFVKWTGLGRVFATVKSLIRGNIIAVVSSLPGKFASIGVKAASALVRGIGRIPGLLRDVFARGAGFAGNIGRAMADWLNRSTPLGEKVDLPSPLPDFKLPALANGGLVTAPGQALVGEVGPEILTLPRGARVDPLPKGERPGGLGGPIVTQVYLDGRQIAEAVGRHTKRRQNRR